MQRAGPIDNEHPWTIEERCALAQMSQVRRHVCVEGWSMIGKWSGTPLRVDLGRISYPFKIRSTTRPAFTNPKFVTAIHLTDQPPRTPWSARGDNRFSGI